MTYRPFSVRESAEQSTYDGPYDGVPAWLRVSLWAWVESRIVKRSGVGQAVPQASSLRAIERTLRVPLDWSNSQHYGAIKNLAEIASGNEGYMLDLVDFLLSECVDAERSRALDSSLVEAGSVFAVEARLPSGFQLCRRVAPGVRAVIDSAVSISDRGGAHLRQAWTMTYGRTPNPSTGFKEAVRAVEAVACPIVLPKDPSATLGKVIGRMRESPRQFRIDLNPGGTLDAVGALRGMCELLWKSQFDRHGTADESVPLTVSQAECETALHLAATLVHWFATGRVTLVA